MVKPNCHPRSRQRFSRRPNFDLIPSKNERVKVRFFFLHFVPHTLNFNLFDQKPPLVTTQIGLMWENPFQIENMQGISGLFNGAP